MVGFDFTYSPPGAVPGYYMSDPCAFVATGEYACPVVVCHGDVPDKPNAARGASGAAAAMFRWRPDGSALLQPKPKPQPQPQQMFLPISAQPKY
jgi:hypothetical protein